MASATKLMTAYLALRRLDLGGVVAAADYDPGPLESLMGLRPGEEVRVRDLLYGLLLASGNDAAITLAEAASGSEEAFVAGMNRAANRLGLDDTAYGDPIGFDPPGNRTTAADLAALTLELRREPLFRRIVDTPRIRIPEGARPPTLVNRNNLVRSTPWVSGVKTGYTDGAGFVLVGSGSRRSIDLVSVVLGAASEEARDDATLELLRYGFSLYERRHVLTGGDELAEVAIAERDVVVPLRPARPVELVVRRDERVDVEASEVPTEVDGPVTEGDRLGLAIVRVDGAIEARVPLEASRSAEAASLIERIDAALPGRRAGAWGLLALGALVVVMALLAVVMWLRARMRPRP